MPSEWGRLLKFIEAHKNTSYRVLEDSSKSYGEHVHHSGRLAAFKEVEQWLKVMS